MATATTRDVLFIDELAAQLGMSVRTIHRRLRAGAFPIPCLPRLDHRHRWSKQVVETWISTQKISGRTIGRRRVKIPQGDGVTTCPECGAVLRRDSALDVCTSCDWAVWNGKHMAPRRTRQALKG
jgi:predicted DNA-binding transcriptional regulator AlpA